MPMKWTPENDRKLFLTYIETHPVSVNYQKISDAWSTSKDEPVAPTAKAISERFAKIRRLAGVSGNGGSKAGPVTPRARAPAKTAKTPASSAKKRKQKKVDTDSEDGDDHMSPSGSEDESPTKTRKTGAVLGSASRTTMRGRPGNFRGTGNKLGEDSAADDEAEDGSMLGDGQGMGMPPKMRIKTEPNTDPFTNGDFAQGRAQAENLHRMAQDQLHNGYSYMDSMSPYDHNNSGFNIPFQGGGFMDMDGGNDHRFAMTSGMHGNGFPSIMNSVVGTHAMMNADTSFGMRMPTNRNAGNHAHMRDSGVNPRLLDAAAQMRISPQPGTSMGIGNQARGQGIGRSNPNNIGVMRAPSVAAKRPMPAPSSRLSVAPSEASSVTIAASRTPRQASRQASEVVSAYVKHQQELDEEDGVRSLGEDSAESQFGGSDEEFV